jgi:hypothetical protein
VAEIVGLLGDGQFRVAALQHELALGYADQADNGAQQGRFPGPVAAGDGQNLAGGHGKAKAREHVAAAAVTGQIDSGKPHQQGPKGSAHPPGIASNGRLPGILSTICC